MKKIVAVLLGGSLVFGATGLFAAAQTDMSMKWTCTTNASAAANEADKAADDKMAKNATSAASAFASAAENCRDCTKITCEMGE